MVVEVVSAREAFRRAARMLNAPVEPYAVAAQLLRRSILAEAPAPRHRIQRLACEALSSFSFFDGWNDLVEDCLDDLIQYGDVFEHRISDLETGRASLLLRPAPPAVVRRSDGSIVLLGVAGDEITPGAAEWGDMLRFKGAIRVLSKTSQTEALLSALKVPELPEEKWLRSPRAVSADEYLRQWRARLDGLPAVTAIEGLEILAGARGIGGRRQRWSGPNKQHSGLFVARRPQAYGNPRWCLVLLNEGQLLRFIDLVSEADVERPCDIGWRVQAALDSARGAPQQVRWHRDDTNARADFFAPLPSWAERRLCVVGEKETGDGRLFSFKISASSVAHEQQFLHDLLWMEQREARSDR